MKKKMFRTSVMLSPEDIEFIDDAAYDFRKTAGKTVTRGAIIRAAIKYLASLEPASRYAVIKVRSSNERSERE